MPALRCDPIDNTKQLSPRREDFSWCRPREAGNVVDATPFHRGFEFVLPSGFGGHGVAVFVDLGVAGGA